MAKQNRLSKRTGLFSETDGEDGDVEGGRHRQQEVNPGVKHSRLWPTQSHLQNCRRQAIVKHEISTKQ